MSQATFYTQSSMIATAQDKIHDMFEKMSTFSNAYQALIYFFGYGCGVLLQNLYGGSMELSSSLMKENTATNLPLVDDIRNNYNTLVQSGGNYSPNGYEATAAKKILQDANEILFNVFANPNFGGNSSLQDSVQSSLKNFVGGRTFSTPFLVTINGFPATVFVPQFQINPARIGGLAQELSGQVFTSSGAPAYGTPEYQTWVTKQQEWTTDLNQLSTDLTDYNQGWQASSKYSENMFKVDMSTLHDFLKDMTTEWNFEIQQMRSS